MDFFSQYNRPPAELVPGESHPDEGKVERTGYVRTAQLVDQFVSAGERRRAYQTGMFDKDKELGDIATPVYASATDVLLMARQQRRKLIDKAKAAEEEKKKEVVDVEADKPVAGAGEVK